MKCYQQAPSESQDLTKPVTAEFYLERGESLKQQGELKTAAFYYYQAIVLKFKSTASPIDMDIFLDSPPEPDAAPSDKIVNPSPSNLVPENQVLELSYVRSSSQEIQGEVAEVYLQQAQLYYEQKHWQKAIVACEQVLKITPNMAGAYRILGNVMQGMGELGEAMGCYAKALEIQPNFAEVYANLGSLFARRQNWQQAAVYYQQALEFNPQSAQTFQNLAKVWSKLGNIHLALKCRYQALRIAPEEVPSQQHFHLGNQLFQQGLLNEANVCYRQAILLNPELAAAYQKLAETLEKQGEWQESAQISANLGSLYAQQQQWQASLDCYLKALQLNPQLAGVYRNIAKVFKQTGALEQADEASYRALKLEPNSAQVEDYFNLGNSFLKQRKLSKATSCYRQVIRLHPSFSPAYHRLGEIFAKQGKPEAASAIYRQAIRRNLQDAESYFYLGETLAAQEQWKQAIVCYKKAVELQPGHWLAHHHLGDALMKLNQWKAASAIYRKTLELNPDFFWTQNNLGDALLKLKRWNEAVDAYRHGINLKADYAWSHYNLGDALAHLKRWNEAVDAYRRAIELNPEHSWSYYNLAESLVHLQQWDEAIEAYHHALQLNPDSPMVSQKLAETLEYKGRSYFEEACHKYQQINQNYPTHLQTYYKALEIQPNNPELYLKLGNALVQHNRLSAAIFYYQMGLKTIPNLLELPWQIEKILEQSVSEDESGLLKSFIEIFQKKLDASEIHSRLRDVLIEANRLKEAMIFNQKSREFQHTYAEIYFQLGNTLARQHLFEQALIPYRRASKLNPEKGWYYKSLGDSLKMLCEFEEAIPAYEKALKLAPENQEFSQSFQEVKLQQKHWNKVLKYCQDAANNQISIKPKKINEGQPLKILILTSYPPFPPTSGGAIRMFEKLKYLNIRHHVVVVSFIFDNREYEIEESLENYCDLAVLVKIGASLSSRRADDEPIKIHWWTTWLMWKTLNQLRVVDFDIVSFEFIFMAPYQKLFEHCFTILEEHNIESDLLVQCHKNVNQSELERAAETERDIKAFQNAEKEATLLREYEDKVWPLFDLRTVVSELERQKLESRCQTGKTLVVCNGVDTKSIALVNHSPDSKKILYMGHMGYYPNIDAVIYLVEQIMPILWQQAPGFHLCIAGREPAPQVQELVAQDSRIELIVNPENMSDLAQDCSLTVVPLRLGSGTRLKILHSMAMGLPVISTSIGAEGLSVIDGINILIRDEPEKFAQAILQIESDADLRNNLRFNGRQLVEKTYDWQIIYAQYEREVLSSINGKVERVNSIEKWIPS